MRGQGRRSRAPTRRIGDTPPPSTGRRRSPRKCLGAARKPQANDSTPPGPVRKDPQSWGTGKEGTRSPPAELSQFFGGATPRVLGTRFRRTQAYTTRLGLPMCPAFEADSQRLGSQASASTKPIKLSGFAGPPSDRQQFHCGYWRRIFDGYPPLGCKATSFLPFGIPLRVRTQAVRSHRELPVLPSDCVRSCAGFRFEWCGVSIPQPKETQDGMQHVWWLGQVSGNVQRNW